MLTTGDILVYADPDGVHYVARDEDGRWFRWPAEAGGWRSRTGVPESYAERCDELEPRFALLALRLSGVV